MCLTDVLPLNAKRIGDFSTVFSFVSRILVGESDHVVIAETSEHRNEEPGIVPSTHIYDDRSPVGIRNESVERCFRYSV
ncbi:hypothetical protein C446_00315 [Halobiforma nitratireducens JCM 10879]|uniref:Uncharacterized protein n=1 Tax=Halobiforma nitratireducens JCM 10879 TaxID=1227454 RepID=M0MN52_9EURY|nr:hypothetical protein C446_00315 [Halobiforma nitratireducens JCM 10879]